MPLGNTLNPKLNLVPASFIAALCDCVWANMMSCLSMAKVEKLYTYKTVY